MLSPPEGFDTAEFIWLLLALVLVSGAGAGFWRFRHETGKAVLGLLIWGAVIAVLALSYSVLN